MALELLEPHKNSDTFGINVLNKDVKPNLCSFVVTGDMHKKIVEKLRSDRMGINYSKIEYQN